MSQTKQFESLLSARSYVQQNKADGVTCPCCDQFAKLYKRKLNASQAKSLIVLFRLFRSDGEYHHVSEISKESCVTDFAQLARWSLIREQKNDDKTKKSSGFWMPTMSGFLFASNKQKAAKYCYIYNGETYGFSEEQITIKEALGDKFNYEELMGDGLVDKTCSICGSQFFEPGPTCSICSTAHQQEQREYYYGR